MDLGVFVYLLVLYFPGYQAVRAVAVRFSICTKWIVDLDVYSGPQGRHASYWRCVCFLHAKRLIGELEQKPPAPMRRRFWRCGHHKADALPNGAMRSPFGYASIRPDAHGNQPPDALPGTSFSVFSPPCLHCN